MDFMEMVLEVVGDSAVVAAAVATALCGTLLGWAVHRKKKGAGNALRKGEEAGTLYVYMFDRWTHSPSGSAFALKLETWLRLVDIPYVAMPTTRGHQRTGKLPYVRLDGEEVYDTSLIIDFLGKTYDVGLDDVVSSDDAALGTAAQRLAEESLYFELVHNRWMCHLEEFVRGLAGSEGPVRIMLPLFKYVFAPKVAKSLWGHGIGRLTDAEVTQRFKQDVASLSGLLGKDDFFLGHDAPTTIDATLFGMVGSAYFSPLEEYQGIVAEQKNLVRYLQRMREHCFPDWDDLCLPHKP